MSLVLMLSLALSVSAKGENAFENVMITADTKIYDAPGTDNPIAYMEALATLPRVTRYGSRILTSAKTALTRSP